MLLIDSLAESRITEALNAGEFDQLTGAGKPLALQDDAAVPEHLRVAYRLLSNAGCLPPEQQLRRDISELEALLGQVESHAESDGLRRRLEWLRTRLALHGGETNLMLQDADYRAKLLNRLDPAADTP